MNDTVYKIAGDVNLYSQISTQKSHKPKEKPKSCTNVQNLRGLWVILHCTSRTLNAQW